MRIFLFILFSAYIFAKELSIGVILPLSGNFATFGEYAKRGLEIAYKLQNQVDDIDIRLIIKDDRSDKVEAATIAKKLIEDDKVVAIIGEIASNNTLSIANETQKNKTPFIIPAATNPVLTYGKRFTIRICYSDAYQGKMIAKYLIDNNLTKVVLVTNHKESYSNALSHAFVYNFKVSNGEVVKNIAIDKKDEDFTQLVDTLKSESVDAIVFSGYYLNAAKMAKVLKKQGINIPVICGDGVNYEKFLELAKDSADNFLVIDHFSQDSKNEYAKDFIFYYQKRYSDAINPYSALFADAYNIVTSSLQECGYKNSLKSIRICINRYLQNLQNYHAITGTITINKQGDAIKPVVLKKIENGKFLYKTTIYP